jgi:hypothetical protein
MLQSLRGKSTGMPPIERVQGPDIKGYAPKRPLHKVEKKGKSTVPVRKLTGKPIENNSLELF